MAKDPAFLFYPGDWVSGTLGMTHEEKGAYFDVLMLQFNRGHMTIDMIERMIGHRFGHLWDKFKDKFEVDGNGLYYNKRLEQEKEKRKTFTESRKNNKLGLNQYQKKNGHMTSHMENENENRNTSRNTKNKKGKNFDENFENVFFADGTYQKLGRDQKVLAERGDLEPSTIIKGSIY